ncbi:ribonuclease P protein component 1 [Thermogladius sp. 4427co]|uniref:ribonuclease P protein component 1 n=1 Tax=Thermogladius sp. 4427co TaxID=3450718 RepID=UPI003F79FAF9
MKVTSSNLVYHELIGLKVRLLSYTDMKMTGLEGRVVDETLKTLVIETVGKKRVRVFKSNGVFEFILPSGEKAIIKGDLILGRPAERLKRLVRK